MENSASYENKKTAIIAALLHDGGSATFARLIAEVSVKQAKIGNPLRDKTITKVVDLTVSANVVYQNVVNNRLEKEGKEANFKAEKNWFTPVFDTKNGSIVYKDSDKTCEYVKFVCGKSENLGFLVDGQPATDEQVEIIKAFTPIVKEGQKQGLDNPVIFRTIKIENIRAVKCGETVIFG